MLKPETLEKYVEIAKEYLAQYRADIRNGKIVHVMLSRNNKKIGDVLNVSLLPVITCGNCSNCKGFCYDIKACVRFVKNVLSGRARNTALALENPEEYFRQIDEKMTRRKKEKFFRFHVGGEIPNRDYFERMVALARKHPDFKIWTYTKMHAIVNMYVKQHGGDRFAAIPENLVVMFSEWDGMPLVNPYGFPVFTVKLKAGNKNHPAEYFETLFKCPGNCNECKAAHSADGKDHGCILGETVYNDEH